MFIVRNSFRRPPPVAESWQRLDQWFKHYAPAVSEMLRPGTTESQLSEFEERHELLLPAEVRESFLIHDGQAKMSHPGAICGQPFDPLDKCSGVLQLFRQLWNTNQALDFDSQFDDECTSFPADAIHCQELNTHWISLSDWDGNQFGVDLDPGPNGYVGQVINFGRDGQEKFVLAVSWAHFLEDFADELEAGHLAIIRDSEGEITGMGRPGHDDQSLRNFFEEWSQAKLPMEFQRVLPVLKPQIFPGAVVTGSLATQAQDRIKQFLGVMYEYELKWLRVRPIHEMGYKLFVETKTGFLGRGIESPGSKESPHCGFGFGLSAHSTPEDIAARWHAIKLRSAQDRERFQIGVHRAVAVDGYLDILREYCTDRKRQAVGEMIQVYPPYYAPECVQFGDVRRISEDKMLVYVHPRSGKVRRYHLKNTEQRWLIDLVDETTDHVRFRRVSVLFGRP